MGCKQPGQVCNVFETRLAPSIHVGKTPACHKLGLGAREISLAGGTRLMSRPAAAEFPRAEPQELAWTMAAASTSELSAAPAGSLEPRRTFPSLCVANGMFLVQPIRPTKKESREMTLREAQRAIRMKLQVSGVCSKRWDSNSKGNCIHWSSIFHCCCSADELRRSLSIDQHY